jgi:protein O-mannosyl-transferase
MNRPRVIGLLLAFITLAIYSPVVNHDFVNYDDNGYVYQNRVVENGLTWAGIKSAFTTVVVGNWHPLTMLSHMLDCQLFGLNPGAQHLVNVLFHIANSLLLLFLLFRLTNSLWPSAMIAALFAWHPLHVESVAWISERKDVLSTFFELLALLTYVRYAKEHRRGSFWVSLLFFALALLSKPMPVTLPFVLLLLDYWPLQRFGVPDSKLKLQNLILEKWPFFALTAVFCVVTFIAQSQPQADAVIGLGQISLPYRLATVPVSYSRYLLKIFWPAHLSIIYPLLENSFWLRVAAVASTALLLLVSWQAWQLRRQLPYLFVGWFWFLGTLVPVIGLVQVGDQSMADRYSYLPSAGVFIAVVFGIRDLISRLRINPAAPAAVAGLLLAILLALTERQLSYWQNSETLFKHAVALNQNNFTAHLNLGLALAGKGHNDAALAEYHKALFAAPNLEQAHNDLAALLSNLGRTHEALIQFQEAANLNPQDPIARLNLGMLLTKLHRLNEATNQLADAEKLSPKNPKIFFQMGRALLFQGHDAEAIAQFREALRLNPTDFEMLVYVARVLASDENAKIRNGQIALAMAAKANDLTHQTQPVALDTIAMACAELGQFSEAQKAEENAIKLATAYDQKDDAAEMQKRLELYKNKRPFRQTFVQTYSETPTLNTR